VVTTEFENIPVAGLERLQQHCPVRPAPEIIAMAQDRLLEKAFLDEHEYPTVAFCAIQTPEDLEEGVTDLEPPFILKLARPHYPGHGQHAVSTLKEALDAFRLMKEKTCILEERIYVEKRLSVTLARSLDGDIEVYPVVENSYFNGLLDITMAPADIPDRIADAAVEMASDLADDLEYCGVLSTDFLLTTEDELLINTLTPRPHNSAHYTVDACVTSQFEQQVRMLCGLPPGDAQLLSPVAMVNLMGDLWSDGDPPWEEVLNVPQARLHLYDKSQPRHGRKMGHINCLAEDTETAREMAESIISKLTP
jgi:5-(carboxyamino)imidazole ribonucleotide synthase